MAMVTSWVSWQKLLEVDHVSQILFPAGGPVHSCDFGNDSIVAVNPEG